LSRMSSAFNEPVLNAMTLIAEMSRPRPRSIARCADRKIAVSTPTKSRDLARRAHAPTDLAFCFGGFGLPGSAAEQVYGLRVGVRLKRPRGRDMAALNFRYAHARAKDNTSAVASVSGSRRFAAKLGAIARSRSCSRILIRSLNSARDVRLKCRKIRRISKRAIRSLLCK